MKRSKLLKLEREEQEKRMEGICVGLQNIVIEDYKVGKKYKVHVTCVNNPHSFYIQPITCTYLNTLEKRGKPAEVSNLFPGSLVVYRSQICNKFVRGHIISQNKCDFQTFKIIAIDYGYIETSISIQHIFMPESLVDVPPLAKHCRLSQCEAFDGIFTDEVTEAMQHYIGNEICVMLVKAIQGGQMTVQLNNSAPNDIATMLALTHYTHFGYTNNTSVSRIKSVKPALPTFKLKSFEVNDVFYVQILKIKSVSPKICCVATCDDFNKQMNDLITFTSDCRYQPLLPDGYFRVGMSVGYRGTFDYHYERAIITSIVKPGSIALVYLIDKAETREAFEFQLREVTSLQYFETPGIAFQCMLQNRSGAASKLPVIVKLGDKLWIKIKKIGDPNIVEIVSKSSNYQQY